MVGFLPKVGFTDHELGVGGIEDTFSRTGFSDSLARGYQMNVSETNCPIARGPLTAGRRCDGFGFIGKIWIQSLRGLWLDQLRSGPLHEESENRNEAFRKFDIFQ